MRSSVEREFIIIGEAVASLARIAPKFSSPLRGARRIVDFRNQLTHECTTSLDWGPPSFTTDALSTTKSVTGRLILVGASTNSNAG